MDFPILPFLLFIVIVKFFSKTFLGNIQLFLFFFLLIPISMAVVEIKWNNSNKALSTLHGMWSVNSYYQWALGDFYCSMSFFRFRTHSTFHCMTAFLPLLICLDLLITVVVSSWPTQISGVYEKGNVIGTEGFPLLKVLFFSGWRVGLSWASLISLWMAKSQKNTMQPIKLAMNSSYFSVCLQLLYWNHFYYLPFVSLNLNLM